MQVHSSPLIITDSDERDMKTYTTDLSKILESNNVSILETSSCSVIIRPHKINSIIVRTLESPAEETKQEEPIEETTEEIKEEEPSEEISSDDGIITD